MPHNSSTPAPDYDIVIIGGGLAGLTAACLLKDSFSVILFDPHSYPRHKLCGEYLSREISPLMDYLEIDLDAAGAVDINQLRITTPDGKRLHTELPLGAYGISRYVLDNLLFEKCRGSIDVVQDKVINYEQAKGGFKLQTTTKAYTSKLVVGATGKRSGLDREIGREFMEQRSGWVAVKRHYQYDHPSDMVNLVAFDGGYAGISKVENDTVNLCYLVSASQLQKAGGISQFEDILQEKNPGMRNFFLAAESKWDKPITISQIVFGKRETAYRQVPMLGDAAGLIHPLCGNGMAMAMHAAVIAAQCIQSHSKRVGGTIEFDLERICNQYNKEWRQQFSSRMKMGSVLQRLLLSPQLTKWGYAGLKRFPFVLKNVIKATHGKPIALDLQQ